MYIAFGGLYKIEKWLHLLSVINGGQERTPIPPKRNMHGERYAQE